jgi:hypothetical protein
METWPESYDQFTQQQLAIWRLKEHKSLRRMISALTHRQDLRWIMKDPETEQFSFLNRHDCLACIKRMVMGQKFVWGQLHGRASMLNLDQMTGLKGIVAGAEQIGGKVTKELTDIVLEMRRQSMSPSRDVASPA